MLMERDKVTRHWRMHTCGVTAVSRKQEHAVGVTAVSDERCTGGAR